MAGTASSPAIGSRRPLPWRPVEHSAKPTAAKSNDPVEVSPVLPSWPFTAMFAAYPIWWVIGFGSMAWIPLAVVMVIYMLRRGTIGAPPGFLLWLIFLLWIGASVIGIDSPGRLIGFVYRFMQYAAVTVVLIYVFNARTRLTTRRVLGVLTAFWIWVVIGGYASIAFPLFSFSTPLSYVLPQGLLGNELIAEMAFRRLTQHNPDSWIAMDPRPSAPFLYTNAWGNVYSMLLPVAVAYLKFARHTWKFVPLLLALPLSLVPAFLTLNRGMFIGIAVSMVFVAVMSAIGGHSKIVAMVLLLALLGGVGAVLMDTEERLETRVSTSSTTSDRANLYAETFARTQESPLFGYGAPRPSSTEGAPPAGTQGQIWTVMFSHGFPAAILYLAWLVWAFLSTLSVRDPIRIAMSSVILVIMVESLYYGVAANGLILAMAIIGVLMRPTGAPSAGRNPIRVVRTRTRPNSSVLDNPVLDNPVRKDSTPGSSTPIG